MTEPESPTGPDREGERQRIRALLQVDAPELLAFLDDMKRHFPGCRMRWLEINGKRIGGVLPSIPESQGDDET